MTVHRARAQESMNCGPATPPALDLQLNAVPEEEWRSGECVVWDESASDGAQEGARLPPVPEWDAANPACMDLVKKALHTSTGVSTLLCRQQHTAQLCGFVAR